MILTWKWYKTTFSGDFLQQSGLLTCFKATKEALNALSSLSVTCCSAENEERMKPVPPWVRSLAASSQPKGRVVNQFSTTSFHTIAQYWADT
jgi:hypothetical protein